MIPTTLGPLWRKEPMKNVDIAPLDLSLVNTLGIDIGGTKIAGARVSDAGEVLAWETRPTTPEDPEGIVNAIAELVTALDNGDCRPVVGVAVAAFVNRDRDSIFLSPNIAWPQFRLKDELEKRLGRGVVLENDANAAGWGEFQFGAARDATSMITLTIGTGVGGAIVDDGRLIMGGFGVAGELGHLIVEPNGHLCGCGNRGCLEQYASGTALMREARQELGNPALTQDELSDLLEQGDSRALKALNRIGQALGRGIASLVAVVDPELIVIGGGVAKAGEALLEPIRSGFHATYAPASQRPVATIVVATLGNTAGVVGAADLARAASEHA